MKLGDTELPARVTSLEEKVEAGLISGSKKNEVLSSKDGAKVGMISLEEKVEAGLISGSKKNEVLSSKDGAKVGITRGDTDLLGVEVTSGEEVKPRSNVTLEEKEVVAIDTGGITTSGTELLGVTSGDGEEVEPRSDIGLVKKELVGKDKDS